jgi:hypothetical protein
MHQQLHSTARRVSLVQLIRFIVMKLIHQVQILNLTCVLHLRLIILSVGGDVPVDSEALLVTDFMNIKIKLAQSFKDAHSGKICVCVYMSEYSYVYEYLCLYCVP